MFFTKQFGSKMTKKIKLLQIQHLIKKVTDRDMLQFSAYGKRCTAFVLYVSP